MYEVKVDNKVCLMLNLHYFFFLDWNCLGCLFKCDEALPILIHVGPHLGVRVDFGVLKHKIQNLIVRFYSLKIDVFKISRILQRFSFADLKCCKSWRKNMVKQFLATTYVRKGCCQANKIQTCTFRPLATSSRTRFDLGFLKLALTLRSRFNLWNFKIVANWFLLKNYT